MIDPAFTVNQVLRRQLVNLIERRRTGGGALSSVDWDLDVAVAPGACEDLSETIDVIVTANEINDKHGTGPLVKRLYQDRRNIFSIRAKNDWGGQEFGDWNVCLPQKDLPRHECFRNVLGVLAGRSIQTVLCVPYLTDELYTSIAIQASFGARLSVYLMDDQNVATHNIPDTLMREFLGRCSLRLVTHPELRLVYERKFGMEFHILPAVAPHQLVATEPCTPDPANVNARRGALIGSFWDQAWFDKTCETLAGCDCEIDWFGNNQSPWLNFPEKSLEGAGIRAHGVLPETELASRLRQYPFVLVPVGNLDDEEANRGVACLSMPGRILFALATSNTPVILLGSDKTCGARLVRHFGVGAVAPYVARRLSSAIEEILEPKNQKRLRESAVVVGRRFSDEGIVEWLETSTRIGAPADDRYDSIFANYDATPILEVLW